MPFVALPSLEESMNANRFRVLLSGNMVNSIVVSGSVVMVVCSKALSNNEISHSPLGRAISKLPTSFTSEVQVTSDVVSVSYTHLTLPTSAIV